MSESPTRKKRAPSKATAEPPAEASAPAKSPAKSSARAKGDKPPRSARKSAEKAPEGKADPQPEAIKEAPATGLERVASELPSTQATLLTGFPGFIGRRLLAALAESQPQEHFVLLVEARFCARARELAASLAVRLRTDPARFEVVEGDITQPHLGLSAEVSGRVRRDLRRAWHLAAVYDLAVPEEVAYRVNVTGTAHVLDFCEGTPGFERLNYISTCYVAGDRTGAVLEDELDEGQRHKNHYESTKFWAEVEVQRRRDSVPTAIFRPAIVVGDSRTGETEKYDGPYFLIRMILNAPAWMPIVSSGDGSVPFNVVPVDFVVSAMVAIAAKPDATGQVFQLADPHPLTAREFAVAVAHALGRSPRVVGMPRRLVEAAFGLPAVRKFTGIPRESVVYFNHPTRFDVSHTLDALEGTGIQCPPAATYLATLIDFMRQHPRP